MSTGQVANYLKSRDIGAAAYHAGLSHSVCAARAAVTVLANSRGGQLIVHGHRESSFFPPYLFHKRSA
jgi:hypothetical protein